MFNPLAHGFISMQTLFIEWPSVLDERDRNPEQLVKTECVVHFKLVGEVGH